MPKPILDYTGETLIDYGDHCISLLDAGERGMSLVDAISESLPDIRLGGSTGCRLHILVELVEEAE